VTNKPYVISDKVLDQFVKLNKSSIENIIIDKIHPNNIVNYPPNQMCFSFNEYQFFIYIVDQDFLITNLISYSYDQLITSEFLNQFYIVRDILPPRLKQWVTDEYLSMLKSEIIEALKYNKMTLCCDSSNTVIFEWKIYGLKFELSNDFIFTKLLTIL